jgi:hypothetical protein
LNLFEQVRKAVTYAAERQVIQELSFAEMKQRQLDIKEAHNETFKWVFTPISSRPSPTHFAEWLEYGDGTFWISGKPGSGKSTLVKTLASSPAIKVCLASRPHNIFVSDFGSDPKQMICIHEFTNWDIRQYIKTVFEGDPTFISCKIKTPKGTKNLQKVSERMQMECSSGCTWLFYSYLTASEMQIGCQTFKEGLTDYPRV